MSGSPTVRSPSRIRGLVEKAWWSFLPELSGGKVAKLSHSGKDVFFRVHSPAEGLRQSGTVAREPWVADWLGRHFRTGEVLYDIGSGVGTYALLAAAVSGARVFAFEAAPELFERFCGNIALNRRSDLVVPIPLTLTGGTGLGPVPDGGEPAGTREALSFRLDDLLDLFRLPRPQHLRVDVPGSEVHILKGAERSLRDPSFKTAMIRVNPESEAEVAGLLEQRDIERVDRFAAPASNGPAPSSYGLWMRR